MPAAANVRGLVACVALLIAGAALHIWYLIDRCPLDLSGDEAHYWEWSRRLDLSYYSKGPLVAWIIAASRYFLADWSRQLVGSEALAVRAPAVVLSVVTGLGIYALGLAVSRYARLALAAVALTATIPILAAGSMLMTIDAPLAACWTWALVCIERALRRASATAWVLAGVLAALGILAKYTMLLIFPVVALALLTEPTWRAHLRRPGPYLAVLTGLTGFLPIAIWNAGHDWVSLRHVAGQAGLTGGPRFDPLGVMTYLGGQLAVVGPAWLVAMWWAIGDLARRPHAEHGELHEMAAIRLLLYAAVVPWGVFLLFSPLTKIQPNWPMLSLIAGTILMTVWLARGLRSVEAKRRQRTRLLVAAGVALGAAAVVISHRMEFAYPLFDWLARGAPPLGLTRPAPVWNLTPIADYDPTTRLRGWSQLGRAVGEIMQDEHARGRDPFILADDYQLASLIAFYCPGEPNVYCAQSALGGRYSQYDLWPNPIRDPQRFLGRPCIYVGAPRPELTGQRHGTQAALPGLRRVRTVEHRVRGCPLRIGSIFVSDGFAGFAPRDPSLRPKY